MKTFSEFINENHLNRMDEAKKKVDEVFELKLVSNSLISDDMKEYRNLPKSNTVQELLEYLSDKSVKFQYYDMLRFGDATIDAEIMVDSEKEKITILFKVGNIIVEINYKIILLGHKPTEMTLKRI